VLQHWKIWKFSLQKSTIVLQSPTFDANGTSGISQEPIMKTCNPHHLPLQHLKDITNNFCNERILGRGGFGVVYKVRLKLLFFFLNM
jgi:hypothetical protein